MGTGMSDEEKQDDAHAHAHAPPHAPPPGRDRLSLEFLVTSGMALLAVLVSAYTVYVERQQLRVQALPRVALDIGLRADSSGANEMFVALRNTGVAPAEIRAFRVTVHGKDFAAWDDAAQYLGVVSGHRDLNLSWGRSMSPLGEVIGAGQAFEMFNTTGRATMALIDTAESTTMDVCYCSALDECWVYEFSFDEKRTTTPVASCPTYPLPREDGDSEPRSARLARLLRSLDAGVPVGAAADSGPDAR
jgi:hypothetical protein